MIIVNISDIEDLVIAKYKIEEALLQSGKIESKYSLNDFIHTYLKFGDNVYLFDEKTVYPFAIIEVEKTQYIFITESEKTLLSQNFFKILKSINYDLTALQEVKIDEFPNYKKSEIFIINGIYKKLHK